MLLKSMSAAQYRSLRSIRMELDGVNVFIGANGVGKTNLYRGLQLVQAAARGTFAREVAAEGGMMQALWAGDRRKQERARIAFSAEVIDQQTGLVLEYKVQAGGQAAASGRLCLRAADQGRGLQRRYGAGTRCHDEAAGTGHHPSQ